MKLVKLFFFSLFVFFSTTSIAQSLAINTSGAAADASAMLDISSTTKGLLVPRMTTTERNTIGSPADGLIIYNTTTSSLEHYNGSSWVSLSKAFVPYTGATAAVNLGGYDLTVNGLTIGLGGGSINTNTANGAGALTLNTAGASNTAFGHTALYNNTLGNYNSATGNTSLYTNTTGNSNTANGYASLYNNTSGYNNTAFGHGSLYYNTSGYANAANGMEALAFNSTGNSNTANGYQSLYTNSIGLWNTANGYQALFSNTNSYNTASGYQSLYANTSGYFNTANGVFSLRENTLGISNTASGYMALYSNTQGSANTAFGKSALVFNITGGGNTAHGSHALNYTTGSYNTAIGNGAGYFITTGSNNIVIGNDAQILDGTYNNVVRLGNTAISFAGIQVAWTLGSDHRWKSDIKKSDLGLDFINDLRPVSYYRNNDDSKKIEYGFIAQEIEASLNKAGATQTGIITKDSKGMYGVRYNDFISPMVKAIQQLSAQNELQQKQISELKLLVEKMTTGK